MKKNVVNNRIVYLGILLTVGLLFSILMFNVSSVASAGTDGGASYSSASTSLQMSYNPDAVSATSTNIIMRKPTNAERVAAARKSAAYSAKPKAAALNPGGVPDYFGNTPNYANSPLPTVDPATGAVSGGIRKFVDSLPGLTPAGANDLGQYIPIAVADTKLYPGSDYYEIGAVTYTEQMHSDLKPTILRGYVQLSTANVPGKHIALTNPDGTPIRNATGGQVYAVDNPHYLGPAIIAERNIPVRIKFINFLPTGAGGDLFLPVDTTVIGAGAGPNNTNASLCAASVIPTNPTCYAQNRATIHLHGGLTPWISDGSQDMWTTPAGENTQYPTGVSTHYVPDMDNGTEPQGTMTFYYANQQSARLMFYHDHAYGITRLNVYAGVAAPYVLRDSVEAALEANGTIPGLADYIPLVIQDKTFLPDAAHLAAEDPTWPFALNASRTDLWFPSVYMPNQNYPAPNATVAAMDINPMGRWDYGPWMFPAAPAAINYTAFPNPLYSTNPCGSPPVAPCEYQFNPGVPQPAIVPEAFVDTPVINGNAYPYLNVGQKAYRFNILSAGNDRGFNLQLYYASTAGPFVRITSKDGNGSGASATVTVDDKNGSIDSITITSGGAGYTSAPNVTIFDAPGHTPVGTGARARAVVDLNTSSPTYGTITGIDVERGGSNYSVPRLCKGKTVPNPSLCTEVRMVLAVPGAATFPTDWQGISNATSNQYAILNGRVGGVPDPDAIPPANMIQFANEAGFLPSPVVIPNRPIGFDYSNTIPGVVTSIGEKALFLDPAERADVVVDFSQVPDGSTLILYSDSPTPVAEADPRYDYYTDDPDNTLSGGAPSTLPGHGPNIRTLMQFRVNASIAVASAFDLAALQAALPRAYAQSQDKPIVPESAYNTAFNASYTDTYVSQSDNTITFTSAGSTMSVTLNLTPKSINDGFDPLHGGLYTMLGVALPGTTCLSVVGTPLNACPIPYNQWDPPTEIIKNSNPAAQIGTLGDGTQIWRIYSNSVDIHPMHWHMFNVQVINRIAMNGSIKPPDPNELGWRETVRANSLEDTIVALRPIKPDVPWDLPNNIRPLDVTAPLGANAQMGFQNIDPTNQTANVTNHLVNFGEEYVWHCHILGHEEAMIMRPESIVVSPNAPSSLTATNTISGVTLTWTDNSTNEINWTVQRATNASGSWTTIASVPSTTGPGKGATVTYTDITVAGNTNYYRVLATNVVGDTTAYAAPAAGYSNMAADSLPSNTATVTTPAPTPTATPMPTPTPTPIPTPTPPTEVGVYDEKGTWELENASAPGGADIVSFGFPGTMPVGGDWNGDGWSEVGVYNKAGNNFVVRNTNGTARIIGLGWAGVTPVAGDWNLDGKAEAGVYNGNYTWALENDSAPGGADIVGFGFPGTIPIAGDWDGDGTADIGVYNVAGKNFVLRNPDGTATVIGLGWAGVTPVVGDWNGDNRTEVGVYDNSTETWALENPSFPGGIDIIAFGSPNAIPVTGDWNGDGKTEVGLYNIAGNNFMLRSPNGTVTVVGIGFAGAKPVVGKWR